MDKVTIFYSVAIVFANGMRPKCYFSECDTYNQYCDTASTICINTNNHYICECKSGFRRMSDTSCIDIDECNNYIHQCDIISTFCRNTFGSYQCFCKYGFQQGSSSVSCIDVDECVAKLHSCNERTSTCLNNKGSYYCKCNEGYEHRMVSNLECFDINECQSGIHKCDPPTTNCINTEGGYRCDCKIGLEKQHASDTNCGDINECEIIVYNNASTNFNNTIGSYELFCKEGFYRRNAEDICEDIDECLETEKYDSFISCTNSEGSFSLQCPILYNLDKNGDKYTCKVSSSKVGMVAGGILTMAALLTIAIIVWQRKVKQKSEQNKNFVENQGDQAKISNVNDYEKQSDTKIMVGNLSERMKMLSDENNGFEKEFQTTASIANPLFTSYAQQSGVKSKNRFHNIFPNDSTRVILKNTGKMFSDYINASHIKISDNISSLIAAQGPIKETVTDFWRMIIEQNVNVIVMMTQLVENNKNKCFLYWPEQHGGGMEFDNILITNLSVITWKTFRKRQLKIKTKSGGSSRLVTQWQYLAWPDHGVPDVQSFLRFRNNVRASMNKSGKTLVHCSSGVGRTGCFIAIDVLLEEATTRGSVDVVSCVRKLNQQRFQLIQTQEQYYFIYLALKEAFEEPSTFIPISNFHKYYLEMLKDGESKLVLELEKLLKETFEEMKSNLCSREVTKPSDKWKVYSADAIDSNKFIFATFPSESDVENFSEICMQHTDAIVSLDYTKESQLTFLPTHGKAIKCQKFILNLTNTINLGLFHADAFTMASHDSGNIPLNPKRAYNRNFTVFRVYVNNDEFLTKELFMAIKNQVNQPPNRCKSTFVLSRDNLKLASFYVACCKLFEQMESHKEVSVYNTVLDLHKGMDQPVFTLTQYKKLYEILDDKVTSKNFAQIQ